MGFKKGHKTIREKDEVLFENDQYCITSILLNNRIDIKNTLVTRQKGMMIDRDFYDTADNRTIESSKKLAEEEIAKNWRFPTKEEKQRFMEAGVRFHKAKSSVLLASRKRLGLESV